MSPGFDCCLDRSLCCGPAVVLRPPCGNSVKTFLMSEGEQESLKPSNADQKVAISPAFSISEAFAVDSWRDSSGSILNVKSDGKSFIRASECLTTPERTSTTELLNLTSPSLLLTLPHEGEIPKTFLVPTLDSFSDLKKESVNYVAVCQSLR